MSNNEIGMLLVMMACVAFCIITVVVADKRIKEEKKEAKDYKELYQKVYKRLNPQKLLNARLERELAETRAHLQAYENVALDTEDELIATAQAMEEIALNAGESADAVSIDTIATELCKRKDVKRFSIDVKDHNYTICGGGVK